MLTWLVAFSAIGSFILNTMMMKNKNRQPKREQLSQLGQSNAGSNGMGKKTEETITVPDFCLPIPLLRSQQWYREAEIRYGNGFLGLLPHYYNCGGNRKIEGA